MAYVVQIFIQMNLMKSKFKFSFVFLVVVASGFRAMAHPTRFNDYQVCSSQNECANIQIDTGFSKEETDLLVNDLSWLTKESEKDETGSPLHRKIFGGSVSGNTYLHYLHDHLRQIAKGNGKNTGLWAYADKKTKRKRIYLMPIFFTAPILSSPLLRTSALIHEIRHLEPTMYRHIPCADHWVAANSSRFDPYDRLPKMNTDTDAERESIEIVFDSENFDAKSSQQKMNRKFPSCDRDGLGAYGVQVIYLLNQFKKIYPELTVDTIISKLPKNEKAILNFAISRIQSIPGRNLLNEDLIGPLKARTISDAIEADDFTAFVELAKGTEDEIEEGMRYAFQTANLKYILAFAKQGHMNPFFQELKECGDWVDDFGEDKLPYFRELVHTYKFDPNVVGKEMNRTLAFYILAYWPVDQAVATVKEFTLNYETPDSEGLTAIDYMKNVRDKVDIDKILFLLDTK
jgi:hypothetical protein